MISSQYLNSILENKLGKFMVNSNRQFSFLHFSNIMTIKYCRIQNFCQKLKEIPRLVLCKKCKCIVSTQFGPGVSVSLIKYVSNYLLYGTKSELVGIIQNYCLPANRSQNFLIDPASNLYPEGQFGFIKQKLNCPNIC